MVTKDQLSKLIDHTLLKPNASKDDIERLCEEAKKHGFWSVCVNPTYVSLATEILRETDVKVCSVVGFPLGANAPEVKAVEAEKAIDDGANEIDMVINIGALKSRDYELVKRDIREVVDRAKRNEGTVVKVIIETGLLTDDEKVLACRFVKESGADFVKTSTGFNAPGATVHDIKFLRNVVGPSFGLKASGGIRTYRDAIKLIEAGANRIGTSSGISIIGE
ncbi:MAG: deoxyribose-phosphate aldolase [Candidatus Bathyarchaeota archaeon]|nr:MAG: deoxyribose-phosphate aldolase [Candidatus Bathyarchaeota archaeon]